MQPQTSCWEIQDAVEAQEFRPIVMTLCDLNFIEKCFHVDRISTICRQIELLLPLVACDALLSERVQQYHHFLSQKSPLFVSRGGVMPVALAEPESTCVGLDARGIILGESAVEAASSGVSVATQPCTSTDALGVVMDVVDDARPVADIIDDFSKKLLITI
eukprot:Rmarinus@m.25774